MADSIEISHAASENTSMLITKITSPMERLDFLLMLMASTSVPSITAPPLTLNPIPDPKKNPPKTATRSLSLVT